MTMADAKTVITHINDANVHVNTVVNAEITFVIQCNACGCTINVSIVFDYTPKNITATCPGCHTELSVTYTPQTKEATP